MRPTCWARAVHHEKRIGRVDDDKVLDADEGNEFA
jgi:hypothetical protein